VNLFLSDYLAQINLALVFGESSHLPFYYRKLAGNIPDSKTIKWLLADLDVLGYAKVKLVMDRGFYSKANVNALYKDQIKFLLAVPMSLTSIRRALDTIYDEFRSFEQYSETYKLYRLPGSMNKYAGIKVMSFPNHAGCIFTITTTLTKQQKMKRYLIHIC